MNCPFCHKPLTAVMNSRPTKSNTQVWRRRKCLNCKEVFTTHENIDLSHLLVLKKSDKSEKYSRMKLYSGIFYASQASKIPNREIFVDSITREIEIKILSFKKKKVSSDEIADITLIKLRKRHTPTFLRYLINCKDLSSEIQLTKELSKYILNV